MTSPDGDRTVVRVGRRRLVAWTVAAAVTMALVAGGVLVARGGRDRSPAVLPALDLGAAGAAAADATSATEPAPAHGVAPARRSGGPDIAPAWPRVTYKLGGPLPRLPERARAWKLEDTADAGRLAGLAAALGLAGRPQEAAAGWTLRDGRRALVAHRLAGVPWSYGTDIVGGCVTRPPGGPWRPGGAARCLDPDTPVASPARPVPGSPARAADRPSPAEAERVARDLAARAGLELDGATIRVTDGFASRTVSIAPAVGGVPTSGFAWTVTVDGNGRVQHATGYLATPRPADTYPLIGVQEGFERLERTSPFGGILRPQSPAVEHDPCPAGGKVPCEARPLPARVATVTGVTLGLQLAPAAVAGNRPAHEAYLLPAYLFHLEGGWTDLRAIVAVQDRYLTG
jgi:hypothetical protein